MEIAPRATNRDALADLRTVLRGIHPPVLSDRGLVGAVGALAVQMSTPTVVTASLGERPPAPIESAVYFAVAESLTNVAKHADATAASVTIRDSRADAPEEPSLTRRPTPTMPVR